MFFFFDEEVPSQISIKLKCIVVERECSQKPILEVEFSNYNISIIYGENGSGKTTLLRLINAFFAQNDSILSKEKVVKMSVLYCCDDIDKIVNVYKKVRMENIQDENSEFMIQETVYYDWDEVKDSPLAEMTSILFGVNRGITNNSNISEDEIFNSIIRTRFSERFRNREDIMMFSHILCRNLVINQKSRRGRMIKNRFDLSEPNLIIDGISMEVIEELLVERYNKAKNISSNKVQKALFNTLAAACDSLEDLEIDDDEYQSLLLSNRDRLILALKSGEKNSLSERIVDILSNVNEKTKIQENGNNILLKKLIVNMSRELNEESVFLQAINRLTEVFNEYIGPDKYLSITDNEALIKFHNSNDTHRIEALSSGERHLLVLLTIFVIEGDKRSIFMVDEPEISLNMTWQRKLLPLLHELAPNAEIIVASHSPSIAKENSNYLVELR